MRYSDLLGSLGPPRNRGSSLKTSATDKKQPSYVARTTYTPLDRRSSGMQSQLERCRRSRAWWWRRRALAATFCCAYPATMEVGQTTSRSLARGHIPPAHALRGSGTDAHPAGSTLGALRPPVAAGQVLRSDCRARAVARICCEVTYRRRASPRSATRIASVA